MSELLEQLHDIEGLDPVSWWPLAVGWWIVMAISICLLCVLVGFAIYWITFKCSWKSETMKKLTGLEKNLSEATARETVILLSEYLRRIALRRFSRKECAGLFGEAWLKWLTQQDPRKFDWEKQGTLLIDIPYAPVNRPLPINQIKELIQAVRDWVR